MKNKNNIKKGFTGMAMLALGLVAVGGYVYAAPAHAEIVPEVRSVETERPTKPELSDEQKQELQELREAGDYDALQEALESWGYGKWANRHAKGMAVKQAINDNDYKSFITALSSFEKFDQTISEEMFVQIVDAHALYTQGEYEQAREIMKSLDVKIPGMKGKKKMHNKAIFEQLTEDQRQEIKELKESGATRDEIRTELESLGVDFETVREGVQEKRKGFFQKARGIFNGDNR